MGLPIPVTKLLSNILKKPGDKLTAEITKSGSKVLKTIIDGRKHSLIQYPSGTIVETIVHR